MIYNERVFPSSKNVFASNRHLITHSLILSSNCVIPIITNWNECTIVSREGYFKVFLNYFAFYRLICEILLYLVQHVNIYSAMATKVPKKGNITNFSTDRV